MNALIKIALFIPTIMLWLSTMHYLCKAVIDDDGFTMMHTKFFGLLSIANTIGTILLTFIKLDKVMFNLVSFIWILIMIIAIIEEILYLKDYEKAAKR